MKLDIRVNSNTHPVFFIPPSALYQAKGNGSEQD